MMLKYGAVLIRGFDVSSCQEFERALLSFQPGGLSDCYRGTSPRQLQEGTSYVFSTAEVPSNFPIAQHLEMSFLPSPPRALFFSCMRAPTSAGGEFALCDFTKVYRDLSPELRQKFSTKRFATRELIKRILLALSLTLTWPLSRVGLNSLKLPTRKKWNVSARKRAFMSAGKVPTMTRLFPLLNLKHSSITQSQW